MNVDTKMCGIEEIQFHTLLIQVPTLRIPTPFHPATIVMDLNMKCEERGSEFVGRRHPY
jgi:hypothetical protein